MARNSLSQESKVDGGVQNRPCPRLSSSTPPMTSTRAMVRKGPRCGWGRKCISLKPASDLAPQLITHVETTQAPLSDEGTLSAIHTGLAGKELLEDAPSRRCRICHDSSPRPESIQLCSGPGWPHS